ncbi:hypothetical protein B0H14DRAFT_2567550 [Mycena olivaceomarginata]|nr:hypothetical protein B0H14DRAFT_2567550 [Mycena olivaceomarginata]
MACIKGDVSVQKMLASSQGACVDVDGEGDGLGVGGRKKHAEPRLAKMGGSGSKMGPGHVFAARASGGSRVEAARPLGPELWDWERSPSMGGTVPDVVLTSRGVIDVCSPRQAQATSRRRLHRLAGARTLPSGVGKPAIVMVRNKGPP